MSEIKTPVIVQTFPEYSDRGGVDRHWVKEADGSVIGCLSGKAKAQAIADALNDHSRLTAENKELRERVEAMDVFLSVHGNCQEQFDIFNALRGEGE